MTTQGRNIGQRPRPLLLFLLLALVCSGCREEPRWRRVESEAGGFDVSMPNDPRFSTDQAESVHGKLDAHFATAVLNGVTYSVMHVDYPPEALTTEDEVLRMAVQGFLFNTGSRLVSVERFRHQGYPGVRFSALNPANLPVQARVLLRGEHLYQLSVLGLNGTATEEGTRLFFDSFELRSATFLGEAPQGVPAP